MADIVKKLLFGPYVGFFFNGHHSSEFGICRVADGDRYTINLAPSYNDSTSERTGWDGTWYEKTEIVSETFDINFASDVIDQETLEELKDWLKPGQASTLIFDETPYKGVSALVIDNPTFDFIPFGKNGERILKGSGKISFITYEPDYFKNTQKRTQTVVSNIGYGNNTNFFSVYDGNFSYSSQKTYARYGEKISYLRKKARLWTSSARQGASSSFYRDKTDYFDWVSEWWDGALAYGLQMTPQEKGYPTGYDNIIVNEDGSDYVYSPHKFQHKDDYIGFFFNGHHSSEFGLIRVTTSEMYTENLLPSYDNITKKGLAANQSFFFNTHITSKIVDINFATDNMSLGDLERLKQWISPLNYGEFYLDSEPNTKYLAKLYGNPTFSFIPFASQEKVYFKDRVIFSAADAAAPIRQRVDGRTIHKGEGKISFIIYEPTPQQIYRTVKEIGMDICNGGPYYSHLSGRFWKEEENTALKEIFSKWTSEAEANKSIINNKNKLKDFVAWVEEWKGKEVLPLVEENTFSSKKSDFQNSNFNYKIILDIPSDQYQAPLQKKEKSCILNFNGRYKSGDNYYYENGRTQIIFYPQFFNSTTKPNAIIVDSAKNLILYGNKTDEKITPLKGVAPIPFTVISEKNIEGSGNSTTTHGILPISFPCDQGNISTGSNQAQLDWYNLWLYYVCSYYDTFISQSDAAITSYIRNVNEQARWLQSAFSDRKRKGKSIWDSRPEEEQHFTFYDYNASLNPTVENGTLYRGGKVTKLGTEFTYNGVSLLNNTEPVQLVTLRKKRKESWTISGGSSTALGKDYDSSNFTMLPSNAEGYNENDKLQVILFSDELLRDLSDYYIISSLEIIE